MIRQQAYFCQTRVGKLLSGSVSNFKSFPLLPSKRQRLICASHSLLRICAFDTCFVMFTCLCSLGIASNKQDILTRFIEAPQRLMYDIYVEQINLQAL
jgi:hypothetical protein